VRVVDRFKSRVHRRPSYSFKYRLVSSNSKRR
jgi:hypothetical protein